jgi:DNA-directed RNA polymerase subunit RPC12/RpoP
MRVRCKWELFNNRFADYREYKTKCGHTLKAVYNEDFMFCPYCGGRIE